MRYITLDMASKGIQSEWLLNGVPVGRLGGGHALRLARPVNHLLVGGENRMDVVLGSPERPDAAVPPMYIERTACPVSLTAGVESLQGGEFPGEGRGDLLHTWSSEFGEGTELGLPLTLSTRFQCATIAVAWSWQEAPRLVLDAGLRQQVHALLCLLVESLRRGDPSLFLRLAQVKFREVCAAFGEDIGQRIAAWADGLRRRSSGKNWNLPEPSLDHMALRLCAGDRMIECIADDREPIVRACQDENGVYLVTYPLFLSLIDGQLAIVR